MAKLYRVGICDDEKAYVLAIRERIEQYFFGSQNEVIIEQFNCVESLLKTNIYFDFLFLDIEMPHMNGIEAKEIIHQKNKDVGIIFVTNYQEFMKQAFGKNVLDYINKNQLDEISNILKKIELEEESFDIINIAGNLIDTRNILYLEAKGSTTIIVTFDQNSQLFSIYLNELHQRINSAAFVRCHKSYVVNLKYIKNIYYDYIILRNQKRLPLSRKYRDSFKAMHFAYLKSTSL